MTDTTTLAPCPYCKSPDVVLAESRAVISSIIRLGPRCRNCGAAPFTAEVLPCELEAAKVRLAKQWNLCSPAPAGVEDTYLGLTLSQVKANLALLDAEDLRGLVVSQLITRRIMERCAPAQEVRVPLSDARIDAAAKVLAQCMDYPWEHMPEQGREGMRTHAKAVITAAQKETP